MKIISQTGRLLFLVPAYNEERNITQVIQGVRQILPQADIVVIDDGSGDNTAQYAENAGAFILRHPFNLCIGGTFQTGLKFAQQQNYDLVIRLDGDGQHDPSYIPKVLTALQEQQADVIICSRFLKKTDTSYIPFMRLTGIRFFAKMVTLITGHLATDTTSGFIGLNRKAIDTLATYMPQDYPEVEGRIILHKCHLTTLEIPAEMRDRVHGQSSINNWHSFYYAIKVSIALLLTACKDFSTGTIKEVSHVYPNGSTPDGRSH